MQTLATYLLVLAAVAAPPIAGPAAATSDRAGDEAAARAAVERLGGVVSPAAGGWDVGFQHRGRELTDEGLVHVARLGNVVALNLRDTQITGEGLVHLKGLKGLRRLHLERTAVSDAGTAHLGGLGELRYLNLYSTRITDRSLDRLVGLQKLEQLYLWQTDVTDAGVARLQRALPRLKIVRGVDLDRVDLTEKKPEPVPAVALKWIPAEVDPPPRSKTGDFITVTFHNQTGQRVKLYWVKYGGGLQFYAALEPGASRLQTTFSDAVWVITDENEVRLGHFVTGTEVASAVIPREG